MAVIQLPAQPGLGTLLGQGLGAGLSTGLQLLAQQRLQQMMQRQAIPGLQALGYTPDEASGLALLDPTVQREAVKQKLLAPQQQAYAQALSELLGAPQQAGLQALQPEPVAPSQATLPPALTEKQATTLAKLGLQKQQAGEKLAFAKEKEEARQKAEAFKLSKPERKQIIDSARDARKSLKDLDRLEELQAEGKLDTPGYVEFLKRSGLDIPALMNPGSEEFIKIAANFIGTAKTAIGGRITNFELEQWLKTLPSLSQSPEGRKRVIANLKYLNRAALEYNEALKEVIAENKGVPPLDLAEKVDDKIDKRLNGLAKKFKEDLAKPVPIGQSSLITGLQATLGTLAGRLPKAAAGAGLGALAGSRFGPLGILGGGALGGLAGLGGIGLKDIIPL